MFGFARPNCTKSTCPENNHNQTTAALLMLCLLFSFMRSQPDHKRSCSTKAWACDSLWWSLLCMPTVRYWQPHMRCIVQTPISRTIDCESPKPGPRSCSEHRSHLITSDLDHPITPITVILIDLRACAASIQGMGGGAAKAAALGGHSGCWAQACCVVQSCSQA